MLDKCRITNKFLMNNFTKKRSNNDKEQKFLLHCIDPRVKKDAKKLI